MMRGAQFGNSEIVRNHKAWKAPFLAEDVVEQVFVAVRGNSVDFIVGGHDGAHMSFFDSGLKRFQKIFTNNPFGIVPWRHVRSAFRLAMYGKMFGGCQAVGFVHAWPVSLKAANCRDSDVRNEVRIFSVGFFRASPARIPRQVQNRRETLVRSASSNFRSN